MGRVLVIDSEPGSDLAAALGRHPSLGRHEVDACTGSVEALRRLRQRAYDVVLTDSRTPAGEDLALVPELRAVRPGIRIVLLAPAKTPEDVIAALRAEVFALFASPIDRAVLAEMVSQAAEADDWRAGIRVLAAQRHWIHLVVSCNRVDAERLVHFMSEMQGELSDPERDDLILAFREVLLNAMEHGAGFDPEKVIDVAAVRTRRTITYYFRDPGPGFHLDDIPHAAIGQPADDPVAHLAARSERGLRPGGFGLLIASRLVDEMMFSETGNEVLLIKHLE
jgi:DNA-binding NarL/FixJ family response regulator